MTANHYTYSELEENDVDLKKLQGWLTKIQKLDFSGADRASEAQEQLIRWRDWQPARAALSTSRFRCQRADCSHARHHERTAPAAGRHG
ncbi:MAG: Chromate resistance protein ChrB [Pseudodonghicola sp.]|uniref:Chromate resistance protein ChrB n=1 Tax=Celeribacter persicus TaxID=1651082 RepID=UPI003CCBA2FA